MKKWKMKAIKMVEAEEELKGPMPQELHYIPVEDALRAVVRATKKSIIRRIQESR